MVAVLRQEKNTQNKTEINENPKLRFSHPVHSQPIP